MFTVIVKKRVHSCFAGSSSNDVVLHRTVILPFPAYEGLNLTSGGWSDVLTECVWDIEAAVFSAWVESDKTLYNRGLQALAKSNKKPHDYIGGGAQHEEALAIAQALITEEQWELFC